MDGLRAFILGEPVPEPKPLTDEEKRRNLQRAIDAAWNHKRLPDGPLVYTATHSHEAWRKFFVRQGMLTE